MGNIEQSIWFRKFAETRKEKNNRFKKVQKAELLASLASLGGNLGATLLAPALLKQLEKDNEPYSHKIHSGSGKNSKNIRTVASILSPADEGVVRPSLVEDAKDFKNILDEAGDYIKAQNLEDVPIITSQRGVFADYYNPVSNSVSAATKNKYITLHELGHAADYRGNLAKVLLRNVPATLAGMSVAPILMHGEKIKEKIPGSVDDKIVDFVTENPVSVSAGAYGLSTLYPEFKASFSPLKHLYKTKGKEEMLKGLKVLGPAYGTYLLGGIPTVAGTLVLKKLLEKKKKKSFSEPKIKKVASLSDYERKLLLIGGLSGGAAFGTPAWYIFNTHGGKALRKDMQEYSDFKAPKHKQFNKKFHDWVEKNPKKATAIAALLGAGLGGMGTFIGMEDMDVVKKQLRRG